MMVPERALFLLLGFGLAVAFASARYFYVPGALGGLAVVFLSVAALLYLQARSLTGRPPRWTPAAGGASVFRRRGGRAVPR